MTVGSLFTGIGGLDLGLERAGMHVKWQCEIDPYCRQVLARHWPAVPCYWDIKAIDGSAERVDLVCGGFPCQPVSLAGRRKAQADPRWLWPEFERVVGLLRPRYVLVENVPGLATAGLGIVVGSLAALGYDAEWDLVSAASVGAPHLRERIFVIAYSNADSERLEEPSQPHGEAQQSEQQASRRSDAYGLRDAVADTNGAPRRATRGASEKVFRPEAVERSGRRRSSLGEFWATEPNVGRVANGVPRRVDRLRVLGNAVVPQVAEFVGRMILEAA